MSENIKHSVTQSKLDWKGRADSQRALILVRLKEAGTAGVLSRELYDDPQCRYGRSPRNRISELKAQGFIIEKRWEGREYRYILRQEPEKPRALPNYYAQKPLSRDWYERQTGQPRAAVAAQNFLPLFQGTSTAP